LGEANSFVAKNAPLTQFSRLERGMSQLKKHISVNSTNKLTYADAHVHLADPDYAGKVDQLVEDAAEHNVSQMLSNATDHDSSLETIKLSKRFPAHILSAVGVHPFAAIQSQTLNLERFNEIIDRNAAYVAAIGEIGLDGKYTQDHSLKARQREAFRFFLTLAAEKNLPAIVHSRQAVQEVLDSRV
jgi:Tat protein secretion system quality control protein TatD with DNase activity